MNEMVDKFLLAGDKFIQFTYSARDHLLKIKKKFKNLKKQEILVIFTKIN